MFGIGWRRRISMTRFLPVAFALVLLPLPALAAETAPADATVLHLSEQAQRLVARDELRAVLRVEGTGGDAARLQAQINHRMAEAVARAKDVAGVTVATGGYSVYAQHVEDQPVQWHGAASLILTATDAPPLLTLVGTLQQKGLVISSLDYELTPKAARAVEDALTDEALARLRARAERVAQTLGLTVLRISDVRLGNASGVVPMPHPLFAARLGAPVPAPVAEPGEATVSVSAEAEVLLVPKR
jgi:uncharacterized protein